MTNKNIKMYENKGTICEFRKMCECTYFAVPYNPFDYDTDFALFTDEQAANLFAAAIHSEVMVDWHFAYLY